MLQLDVRAAPIPTLGDTKQVFRNFIRDFSLYDEAILSQCFDWTSWQRKETGWMTSFSISHILNRLFEREEITDSENEMQRDVAFSSPFLIRLLIITFFHVRHGSC